MSIRRSAGWVALALSAFAVRGIAQSSSVSTTPGYAVSGTVADQNGKPVFDAEVALIEHDSATRRVRTDAEGHFRLEQLSDASNTLRVRRLGFRARTVPVTITGVARETNVVVTLEQSIAALDPMKVVEEDSEPVMPDARLEAFYKRAQTNSFGRYITEAMIEKAHPQYVSELMRTLPGVLIRPTRVSMGSASRIGNTVRFRNCGVQRESPEAVGPLVWLDGVRMPGAELDEVTQANDVAAIEVYPSLAGIPAQFFDRSAVCGTILVWTKNR